MRPGRTDTANLSDGRALGLTVWPGRGLPAVLVHGLLDCGIGWEPVARRTRRTCVAVDLPGFAASDLPERPRLSAYADDVLEAVDQVGVDRFLLVGHSLGGGVATAMAERAAGRVAGLVLLAPVGFGRIPMAEAISVPGVSHAVRLGFPVAVGSRVSSALIYRAFVANGLPPEPELLERLRSGALRTGPGAWAANQAIVAAGASRRAFFRRQLAFDGPVDVLWGERDRLVPHAHAERVHRGLPQARIDVWEGMGHHPQRERPDELVDFLETAWARAESRVRQAA